MNGGRRENSSGARGAPMREGMRPVEIPCQVCDADLILAGDERAGDLVHCSFCGAPFVLRRRPTQDDEDEAKWEAEQDF